MCKGKQSQQEQITCLNLVALVLANDDGCEPLCILPNDPQGSVHICQNDDGPLPRPLQRFEGQSLVLRTVNMLSSCEFKHIRVISAPSLFESISHEIEDIAKADVVPYDPEFAASISAKHSYFEVFGLNAAILSSAQMLAEQHHADGVFVIPCDLANFQPCHVERLVATMSDHPEAEVIASWITWLNRPPYLLRTSFLESLEDSYRCLSSNTTECRPFPNIRTKEVSFGSEMLSAQPPATNPQTDFFANCTLTALEAIRMAKRERSETNDTSDTPSNENKVSAYMNAAFSGGAFPSLRCLEDEALLKCARDVLEKLEEAKAQLAPSEKENIKHWDAWAHRNKLDFPIFGSRENADRLVYLDSAATSQRVGCALDAQYRFDALENANVYRGAYTLSANATKSFNDARETIERHLNARRRSVIFTSNTSNAIALAASSWGERNIASGDRILVPENEHHSNILPWMMLANRKNAKLQFIPINPDGRINLQAYEQLLSEQPAPKLVSVAHVGNVMGIVNPVRQMAILAHQAGARILVDAAQSFAHLPIRIDELHADFVAISAHKAYGPMGLGALWASAEAFAEMEPRALGGGTVSHVERDSYELRDGAIAYEMGTPPVSQAVGFAQAVNYLNSLGFDAIEAHGKALTHYLVCALRQFEGITIWGDHTQEDGQVGLVSFTQAGIPPKTIASVMGALNVAVRAGGHCALPLHASMGLVGSVRFSLSVHTTAEDIEAGLVALEMARRLHLK